MKKFLFLSMMLLMAISAISQVKKVAILETIDKEGNINYGVKITPKFDGAKFCPDYDKIYGSLKGTKYYGCCPDMLVDGKFYEHEGFTTKNAKNAFRNMCNHGLRQSDRIVIENCGLTDGSMLRSIHSKIHSGMTITEVWIHEHNGYRRLY